MLDFIAIILIGIDDLYYVGTEKIIPILITILIPIIGAIIIVVKLKGSGSHSNTNGNYHDVSQYEEHSSNGNDF